MQTYKQLAQQRAQTYYAWAAVTDAYERLFYQVGKRPLPSRLSPVSIAMFCGETVIPNPRRGEESFCTGVRFLPLVEMTLIPTIRGYTRLPSRTDFVLAGYGIMNVSDK